MISDKTIGALKLIFKAALIIIVLFLVSSYFLAMILGPALFFFTEGGLSVSGLYPEQLPIMLFAVITFAIPGWLNLGTLFLLLLAGCVACFVAAWRFKNSFHAVIKKGFLHPTRELFKNSLFAMPLITSILLIAVTVIQGLQEAQGVPTGEAPLPEDPFKAFFILTYAVFVEEIGFRISPIGAYLIIYLLFTKGRKEAISSWAERLKTLILTPLFPEKGKRRLGVKTISDFGIRQGISLGEWIMVIWTSIAFGLAHYLFGGGWEIGKITSTTVFGFCAGITYLVYGFQAPILLHWFFNYYFKALSLAPNFHPGMASATFMIETITVLFGLAGCVSLMTMGVHRGLSAIAERVG